MSEATELLIDLRERCVDAAARLKVEAGKHPNGSREQARLAAKSDGVMLVLDYLRDTMARAETQP